MATITRKTMPHRNNLGSTPWGNLNALLYIATTNALGALENSDTAAAIASGDKVRVGVIPAGTLLYDSQVIVSTPMSANVTLSIGFEYVDGVDSAIVPQSATYFGTALAASAAARLRNATANAPVTLPKDAYLILTTGGAANAKASRVDVVLEGISEGVS